MKSWILTAAMVLIAPMTTLAQDVEVLVRVEKADLFDAPNGSSVGTISKGKRLKATTLQKEGFRRLKTKSGRALWIQMSDVELVASGLEDDIETVETDVEDEVVAAEDSYTKLTYDVGFSAGNVGDRSYQEANFGLNYFFQRWLVWRNSLFARFTTPDNIYGLDSGLRLIHTLGSPGSSLTVFAGPGYRFVSKGDNVPFVEGGLVTSLAGFTIGGGLKHFFTSTVNANAPDDRQYFIILSGSGSIF